MSEMRLVPAGDRRRAWMVLGSGGVGKTTLSAALALRLAEAGHRTAVVTLDPARRLADALRLSRSTGELQPVALERLEARLGVRFGASLSGGVLDTRALFDALVHELVGDPEKAARILGNRYYQKLSTSLAGAENFMAMARLDTLLADPAFDRVVFDTPPAFHTLDFLATPQRLTGFLDFPGVRPALRLMNGPTQSWSPLVQVGRLTLKGLERFLGREFLAELFGFLALFADVLESFAERARRIEQVLASPDVGYLLVAAPTERSLAEARVVLARFRDEGRRVERVVINRVHPARFDASRLSALGSGLEAGLATSPLGPGLSRSRREGFLADVPRVIGAYEGLARRERRLIEAFHREHDALIEVDELSVDVDGLESLYRFAQGL
jgi:anion-transporting  ArsA/GET3 family ATPase